MKKLRLIAMFALTFALVFGAASCKNEEEEGPWGESLAEVLKNEPKLDLSGTWKAFEAELEMDVDGEKSRDFAEAMMYKTMIENLPLEEKIDYFCGYMVPTPKEVLSTKNEFAEQLVAFEAYYSKKDKENNIAVMINSDRNEIRIECSAIHKGKDENKKDLISEINGFATYAKQK